MRICNVLPESQLNEVLQFNIIPSDINEEAQQRFEPQVILCHVIIMYLFKKVFVNVGNKSCSEQLEGLIYLSYHK